MSRRRRGGGFEDRLAVTPLNGNALLGEPTKDSGDGDRHHSITQSSSAGLGRYSAVHDGMRGREAGRRGEIAARIDGFPA